MVIPVEDFSTQPYIYLLLNFMAYTKSKYYTVNEKGIYVPCKKISWA